MTVLVYLPYLPWTLRAIVLLLSGTFLEAPSRCQFCLVVFFNFPVARLYTHCHPLVTLCIYQLHHPQPRSISLTITFAHSTTDILLKASSSNCVHYKVYFILHFIIYFFFYLLLPMCRWSWLKPQPVSVYFLVFPHFPHIYRLLFIRASHQHFVYLHSLSFLPHAFVTGTSMSHSTPSIQPVCLQT